MAINSFEVGAIFTIKDQSTAVLREMTAQMERLEGLTKSATAALTEFGKGVRIGGLVTRMNELGESMTKVAASSAELKTSFIADFESINAGLFETVSLARQLALAMGEVGVMSARAAAGGAAGAGGGKAHGGMGGFAGGAAGAGGGKAHGGMGGFAAGASKAGGIGYLLGHPAAMIAGYLGYEGAKSDLQYNFAIDEALGDLQIAESARPDAIKQLKDTITKTARGTIYSEADTSKFLPTFTSIAGASFTGHPEKVDEVFPVIARMAELAELRGLGSGEDAIRAAVPYAHMTKSWEGEKLIKAMDTFYKVAKTTHTSMLQEEKAIKYVMPTAMALGIDPNMTAETAGFMQIMGLSGTTSGTAFNRMLLGSMKSGGPQTAHMRSQENLLERLLGGKGGTVTPHGMKPHMEALKNLHIMDDKGNLLIMDKSGNYDLMGMLGAITDASQRMDKQKFMNAMFDAFGNIGARMADMFADPDTLQRLISYRKNLSGAMGVEQEQTFLAKSDLQHIERDWAEMKTALQQIVDPLMPTMITALDVIKDAVKVIAWPFRQLSSAGDWWEKQDHPLLGHNYLEGKGLMPPAANPPSLKKEPAHAPQIHIQSLNVYANDAKQLLASLPTFGAGSIGTGYSNSRFTSV